MAAPRWSRESTRYSWRTPGWFPEVPIDNEKRDDATVTISSGGLDRRQKCGVVE